MGGDIFFVSQTRISLSRAGGSPCGPRNITHVRRTGAGRRSYRLRCAPCRELSALLAYIAGAFSNPGEKPARALPVRLLTKVEFRYQSRNTARGARPHLPADATRPLGEMIQVS